MPILTTAITTFILLVLIGIIVGLFFNRGARSWLGRRVAHATGAGDVTYAIVLGFHIGVILELLPSLLLYIAAIAGAALTLILWRRSSAFRPKAASGIGRHPLRFCRLFAAGRSVGSLLPSLRFVVLTGPAGRWRLSVVVIRLGHAVLHPQ